MAADSLAERVAVGSRRRRTRPSAELAQRARRAGTFLAAAAGVNVVLVDVNSRRIADRAVTAPRSRASRSCRSTTASPTTGCAPSSSAPAPALVIVGRGHRRAARRRSTASSSSTARRVPRDRRRRAASTRPTAGAATRRRSRCCCSRAARRASPRRRCCAMNLASYLVDSLEFGGAGEDEAADRERAAVPHRRRVLRAVDAPTSGRRVVQLEAFDPDLWVRRGASRGRHPRHGRARRCSTASSTWSRRDGARPAVAARARPTAAGRCRCRSSSGPWRLLPDVDFVNAYGLTETSSTIAVLGPDDHRAAFASDDPAVRGPARLGRPAAARASSCRSATPTASRVAPGERGEIWVRGEQVSGEYLGRDAAHRRRLVPHPRRRPPRRGRLPVRARPARRRDRARRREPLAGRDRERAGRASRRSTPAAVVGIPDAEWGERVVAAVVLEPGAAVDEDELRDHVRGVAALHQDARADRRSAPSCRSTRPASCCGGCCARSWPTRSPDSDVALDEPSARCRPPHASRCRSSVNGPGPASPPSRSRPGLRCSFL